MCKQALETTRVYLKYKKSVTFSEIVLFCDLISWLLFQFGFGIFYNVFVFVVVVTVWTLVHKIHIASFNQLDFNYKADLAKKAHYLPNGE